MTTAREIALEVFRKQAEATMTIHDPILPVEQALEKYAQEKVKEAVTFTVIEMAGKQNPNIDWPIEIIANLRDEILNLLKKKKNNGK